MIFAGNPESWYRHDHSPSDGDTSPQQTPRRAGPPVEKKQADQWYNYDEQEVVTSPPALRFYNSDAEGYLQRGREGTASNWYGHDTTVKSSQHSPRVTSADGKECATKGIAGVGVRVRRRVVRLGRA